jgi:exopolyphosphatase/guanosine-5'-triphosphate,3'-diphosphate pyrophosphatase
MLAAVDVGTDGVRLAVGEIRDGRVALVRADELPWPAGDAALDCLRQLRATLDAIPAVRVVATSERFRQPGASDLVARAEQAIARPIDVLSGEEEGRLAYLGVAGALAGGDERRLVVDLGAGSTKLILGRGPDIARVESVPVGTLKQSLAFFVGHRIEPRAFDAAVRSARSHLQDAAPPYHPQYWQNAYGSGPAVQALAALLAQREPAADGLTLDGLNRLRDHFLGLGVAARPADAALAAALAILIALISELGIARLLPVDSGLRLGVLWDLHHRAQQRDRRDEAVAALAARFGADPARGARAAANACALHAQLAPTPGAEGRLLHWAALLHETGMSISPTAYHEHAAYLATHADLPGFTLREQAYLGRLLLAQKGNLRKVDQHLVDSGFVRAVLALRLGIVLMHCRLEADPAALQLRLGSRLEIAIRRAWWTAHPTLAYWIEKEQEYWDDIGIDLHARLIH